MNIEQYLEEQDYQISRRVDDIVHSFANRRPKLKIQKVPEDLRSVRIKLHVPFFHQGHFQGFLPLPFTWNLNDQHISPKEFIELFLAEISIPQSYAEDLVKELSFQLIDYIERHSFEIDESEYQIPSEFKVPEKRRPGRPAKNKNPIQQQIIIPPPQPTSTKPKRTWIKSNVICNNCQFANTQAGYECKKCRLPFAMLEIINLNDPVQLACTQLYELVAQQVGNLSYFSRTKRLVREDFLSLYKMREKLMDILENEAQVVDPIFAELIKEGKNIEIVRQAPSARRGRQRLEKNKDSDSENEDKDESS